MIETVVQYNSIELSKAEIQQYRCEPVYDESGVIVTGWRHAIVVNGIVHGAPHSAWSEALQTLKAALSVPRKRLVFGFRDVGTAVLTVHQQIEPAYSGSGSDIDNGPRPSAVVVTQVHGGLFAVVQFAVEWTTAPTTSGAAVVVTSHRWAQTMTVDDVGYTTRVVTGVLTLATSATLSERMNPDSYRSFVYPKFIPGFKRTRAEFVVSESMRVPRYTIEDREQWRKAPGVALVASGNFSVDINMGRVEKTFTIELTGRKGSNPGLLLQAAFTAMKSRITLGPAAGAYDTLLRAQVTEDLFSNRITLVAQALSTMPGNVMLATAGTGFFLPLDPLDPPSASQTFNQPTPYGTALIKAAMQPLFDVDASGMATSPDVYDKALVAGAAADDAPVGVVSVMAPEAEITIPASLAMTTAASVVDDDAASSLPYEAVTTSVRLEVQNNLVTLSPASKDAPALVVQTAPPRVVFRHSGSARRVGAPPQIPEPSRPDFSHVEGFEVWPGPTEVMASRGQVAFTASWRYDVVVRYDPSSPLFSLVPLPGGAGTVIAFASAAGAAFTRSPMLSAAAHASLPAVALPDGLVV